MLESYHSQEHQIDCPRHLQAFLTMSRTQEPVEADQLSDRD